MRSRSTTAVLSVLAVAAAAAAPSAHAQGGASGPPSQAQPEPEPPPASPPPELVVETPARRTLIHEGQAGRYLLAGRWYFRQDDAFVGDEERWFDQTSLEGWTPVSVPHSWNARDTTLNRPTVGWYRKELRLPRAPRGRNARWKVRFEGSNQRSWVWLNGRFLGGFAGYFPFELYLRGVRRGRNTLVVKVSTLRGRHDLTHWRPAAFNGFGTGGWWNSGGLLREVYLRRVDTIDIERVDVLPRMRCVRCPARVEVRILLRNASGRRRKVDVALRGAGQRVLLRRKEIDARRRRELRTRFTIRRPRLWRPGRPALYAMTVAASTGGELRARYRLRFGVRRLGVRRNGVVTLNGRPVQLRGASIHEDDRELGAALTPQVRRMLVRRLRNLGATMTRSHYPLHPAFLELFDRLGILYWVQAPVYQLPNGFFDLGYVRGRATRAVRATVRENLNHPSVVTWSLANEPAGSRSDLGLIGPGLARYIEEAAAAARELDDTRLIAIDRQSRIGEPLTHPVYEELDALGVNEYFGWYRSVKADLDRPPAATGELGPYLDRLHAANPSLALFVTEFGAEASRHGPEEQRGSYEFQRRYLLDHLAIHGSRRFVNGSLVWALRDFRVGPNWHGGAPPDWATPPWHNKSLIEEYDGRKPAYFDVRRLWRRTKPLR